MKALFTPVFMLAAAVAAFAQQEKSQKINIFNPEKDYPAEEIRQRNYAEAGEIVRDVVADFGLDRSHRIALQVNGTFVWRVEGNGVIYDRSRLDSLNRRVRLVFLEKVEARFDPNFWDGATQTKYTGRINFVVEELPDRELNPLEKRILAMQKKQRQPRVPATAAVRGGVLAGIKMARESFYGGVAVEVPLSLRMSLQAELSYGSIEGTPRSVAVPDQNYLLQTVESTVFLKRYFNHKYPRFFGTAGVFVEQGWGKLEDFFPPRVVLRENRTAVGMNLGIGIQFSFGLFMDVKVPITFTPYSKVLEFQNLRGAAVTLGVLFGKP